jgi:hypothetical protein
MKGWIKGKLHEVLYYIRWASGAWGCSEIVGLDLAIRVGLGYCLLLGPLFWECPCPWNYPTQKSISYLGKLEEHVVIFAIVFSLTIFT